MAAQYPGAASTDSNLYISVNNLATTLTDNPLTSGATVVNVTDTTRFPTVGFLSIDAEIIKYTGIVGNQFTGCVRGSDGTSAAAHAVNSQVFHNVIAIHHNTLKDEIEAIEADLVASYTGGSTSIATTFAKFLKLTGGTLSGALNLGGNKITNLANGTVSTDAAAFGQLKVLQIVTTSNTTPFSTTSNTFQTTNSTLSITPTSASSRILIFATGTARSARLDLSEVYVSLFRGTTNLGGGSGNNIGQLLGPVSGTVVQNFNIGQCMVLADSPATTSAVTYSVKIQNTDNVTTVVWGNESLTSMILIEVV